MSRTRARTLFALASLGLAAASAQGTACRAASGAVATPVVELYTSEGCSSCPPADRWLSGLRDAAGQGRVVAQAFHVSYWDYLGWVDRFAAPAHTRRQREQAASEGLRSIYTPQLVIDGRDSRDYEAVLQRRPGPPGARITMELAAADRVVAMVDPATGVDAWEAYWTVTEDGHRSKVTAGENSGERLLHDFVVRQYVPVGRYRGAARLELAVVPATAHPRRVNLVVTDARSRKPLQALSLGCSVPTQGASNRPG